MVRHKKSTIFLDVKETSDCVGIEEDNLRNNKEGITVPVVISASLGAGIMLVMLTVSSITVCYHHPFRPLGEIVFVSSYIG